MNRVLENQSDRAMLCVDKKWGNEHQKDRATSEKGHRKSGREQQNDRATRGIGTWNRVTSSGDKL